MTVRILITFLFLFTTFCDCNQVVSGRILDESTGQPIIDAKVYNKSKEWNKIETDTLGAFELSAISGGLAGCPPMTIIVEKDGYNKMETLIPAGGKQDIKLIKK